MTRINLVPPNELIRNHLMAEYRELPRIYALARKWLDDGKPRDLPKSYRLGRGHVLFFYNKLKWVNHRWGLLCYEMVRRGYNPAYWPNPQFTGCEEELWNDWSPSEEEVTINRLRIAKRRGLVMTAGEYRIGVYRIEALADLEDDLPGSVKASLRCSTITGRHVDSRELLGPIRHFIKEHGV